VQTCALPISRTVRQGWPAVRFGFCYATRWTVFRTVLAERVIRLNWRKNGRLHFGTEKKCSCQLRQLRAVPELNRNTKRAHKRNGALSVPGVATITQSFLVIFDLNMKLSMKAAKKLIWFMMLL